MKKTAWTKLACCFFRTPFGLTVSLEGGRPAIFADGHINCSNDMTDPETDPLLPA